MNITCKTSKNIWVKYLVLIDAVEKATAGDIGVQVQRSAGSGTAVLAAAGAVLAAAGAFSGGPLLGPDVGFDARRPPVRFDLQHRNRRFRC